MKIPRNLPPDEHQRWIDSLDERAKALLRHLDVAAPNIARAVREMRDRKLIEKFRRNVLLLRGDYEDTI